MCGYDPFKWADAYETEEEYLKELEDEMANKIEIDLDAITQRMDELKDAKARYTFELKQVEKEIEKEELKLIALLDQAKVDSMDYGCYSFGWVTATRQAFDQQLFKEQNPDLFQQYYLKKENRNFKFKINK